MSIQDTISEMSDDDAIAAADALISEWIADQLMGDDVTSGGDSQVAALRQRATQYQDFLAPGDMKVIAGAARQALGFLSESFGENTSVGATLLDVIESPTVPTDQHGAGKFVKIR